MVTTLLTNRATHRGCASRTSLGGKEGTQAAGRVQQDAVSMLGVEHLAQGEQTWVSSEQITWLDTG